MIIINIINMFVLVFLYINFDNPLGIGRDLNHPHTIREVSACLLQKKAHFVEGISTRKYSSDGQRSQKNRQAKFRISVLGMIYGLFGDKDPNTRLFSQKKESNLNTRLPTSF